MLRRHLVIALALLATSCAASDDDRPRSHTTPLLDSPLATGDSPASTNVVLLDRRADGVSITGVLLDAPANADPDRVVVVRVASPSGVARSIAALEGRRVLDARFLGDGSVVVLDTDHTLRVVDREGQWAELDVDVEGPLSVAGQVVVYVRGEMPDLEVARADATTGVVDSITHGMAPAWSPAVSPDGRIIVFVSGREGSPRLYRTVDNAPPEALPRSARFPTSPRAPTLAGERLHFEDETGGATLDLATGRVLAPEGAP